MESNILTYYKFIFEISRGLSLYVSASPAKRRVLWITFHINTVFIKGMISNANVTVRSSHIYYSNSTVTAGIV